LRDDIHDLATSKPVFPAPYEPLSVIMAIQARPSAVLPCAAPHFGAAIPLGIFTATVVSRLRFLGVAGGGCGHRAIWRLPDGLHDDGFIFGTLGDD
jgi:hypothetical protein